MIPAQVLAISALAALMGRVPRGMSASLLAAGYALLLSSALLLDWVVMRGLPTGWVAPDQWLSVPLAALAGAVAFTAEYSARSVWTHRVLVVDGRWLFCGRPATVPLAIASVISAMEEFLYRGYLAASMGSTVLFLVVSAGTFGLAHASFGWAEVLSKSVLGLACAAALLTTGSLLPPLALHLTYNWFALIQRDGTRTVMI
jgi:membrane protease YdiL (CAAX protease family)